MALYYFNDTVHCLQVSLQSIFNFRRYTVPLIHDWTSWGRSTVNDHSVLSFIRLHSLIRPRIHYLHVYHNFLKIWSVLFSILCHIYEPLLKNYRLQFSMAKFQKSGIFVTKWHFRPTQGSHKLMIQCHFLWHWVMLWQQQVPTVSY